MVTAPKTDKHRRRSPHKPRASERPYLGAIPYRDAQGKILGSTFRVWAPFAKKVAVIGDFNQWSATANPLVSEGNGNWSADVADALPNHAYKYLVIGQASDEALYRNDPRARYLKAGNSVIIDRHFDWGDESFQMPAWNELVIYEMHIGTFTDVPGKDPGHLTSALEKFPYLKELGINAVEVMPPAEFNGQYSWGYNPAFPFAIEDTFGDPDAFRIFVKEAHRHGIAVIMDVVYNHFGPDALSMWQFDGWSEHGKGGVYFYNDWRCWTPWGDTRPDYGRAEVRQFVRDNAVMWLEEYRVDGLRLDATAFIRNVYGNDNDSRNDLAEGYSLMQWINEEVDNRHPWKITIAEDLGCNPWLVKSTDEGGAGFSSQWDIGFLGRIRKSLIVPDDYGRDMHAIAEAIQCRFTGDAFSRVIYTESHDEVANLKERLPEAIWPGNASSWFSRKRSTLGAALVFTSPGIPMIFQGQELLEDRWFDDQDPLDWGKLEQFGGIHDLYRDLIRLRRNWQDNTRGLLGQEVQVYHLNNEDKLIAFHRWEKGGAGDDVIVVMNFADRGHNHYILGLPRPGFWRVRFNSDWNGYSPDFGNHPGFDTKAMTMPWGKTDGMVWAGKLGIGPYSVLILSQ